MFAGSKATRVPHAATSRVTRSMSDSPPSPLRTMLQPARASASAMPRPMPDVDPVTTAVLPLRDMPNSRRYPLLVSAGILPQSGQLAYAPRPRHCASAPGRAPCAPGRGGPHVCQSPRLALELRAMTPEAMLAAMCLTLPEIPTPLANYVAFKRDGATLFL